MSIIFPLSVVDGIMGELAFMYEFMHVCKTVCIYLILCIYVGVHVVHVVHVCWYCVLGHYFIEKPVPTRLLRERSHNFVLPPRDNRNFISRALYKALSLSNG